jgi:hypothetical protein
MRYLDVILGDLEVPLLIVAFIIASALFVVSLRHKPRPASGYLWHHQNPKVCQRMV